MKGLHPLAGAALAAFALCATIALAADLGYRDAAAQFDAAGAPVVQVYSSGSTGAPALDEKTAAAFRAIEGVRAAVAITEVPVTLSGLDYTLSATVFAVEETALESLRLPLQQGALPDSAWRTQALVGSKLASELAEATNRVDLSLPGTVRLTLEGGGTLDVQLSGVAQATGTARDDGLWLDESILRQLLPVERSDNPLPITRVEVEARTVAASQEVAQALRAQRFLVENPAQDKARTLEESSAMSRQWGVLAALALASTVWALWRKPPVRLQAALIGAVCSAAVGIALAAALMQVAMLLGARFFLSADARYLLDSPRLLAVELMTLTFMLVRTTTMLLKRNFAANV